MNGLNDSINTQVADAPATDAGAQQRMTPFERVEALSKLSPDNLDLFEELLEELERPDVDLKAAETWFEFESARRDRAKSRKEAATAAPAPKTGRGPPANEPEAAPNLFNTQLGIDNVLYNPLNMNVGPNDGGHDYADRLAVQVFAKLCSNGCLNSKDALYGDDMRQASGTIATIAQSIRENIFNVDMAALEEAHNEAYNLRMKIMYMHMS